MTKRTICALLALAMLFAFAMPALAAEDFQPETPAEEAPAEPAAPEALLPAEEEPVEAAPVPADVDAPAPAAVDEPMPAASGVCGSGLTWDLTGGTLTIRGAGAMSDYNYDDWNERGLAPWYGQRITSLVIESGVTSIGNWAFLDCDAITRVTIPATVTSIGDGAFEKCTALTAVGVSAGITTIGAEAFSQCASLTAFTIPYTVTSVGHDAFAYCSRLASAGLSSGMTAIPQRLFAKCAALQTVSWPSRSRITVIGDSAFEGCVSLRAFTIPSGVANIGHSAFQGCSTPASLTIPASVRFIGEYAFADCTSLSRVTFQGTVAEQYDHAFSNTPWQEAKGNFVVENGVLKEYQGPGGSVTIPGTVTSIGDRAFLDRTDVTSVTIPSTVRSIGERAFACSGLRSVTVPSGVTAIGSEAFMSCVSLASVSIPGTVTALADRTFFGCKALVSVTVPAGVRTLGAGVFRACTALTGAWLPSTVTAIGEYAFAECPALRQLSIESASFTYGDDDLYPSLTVYGGAAARRYAAAMGTQYSADMPSPPATGPTAPSANWTGWLEYGGTWYYFKNGDMKKDYWVLDASAHDLWYHMGADGSLDTGFMYITDKTQPDGWFMLQSSDYNGMRGAVLDGWQQTGANSWGWFQTAHRGHYGECTYTDAWGDYNAAAGVWADGQTHH